MNVDALSSQTSASAALLATQAAGSGSGPSAAQLADDRQQVATKAAKSPSASDVKKAANQFEAIILRQLLEPSIQPIMSGGMGGGESSGGGIYGYMLTDVLANSLSQGGGLGLAHMLEKQFTATSSAHLKTFQSSTSTPSP